MLYTIVALTNDRAQLIVSETRTSDAAIATMIEKKLKSDGFIVVTTWES